MFQVKITVESNDGRQAYGTFETKLFGIMDWNAKNRTVDKKGKRSWYVETNGRGQLPVDWISPITKVIEEKLGDGRTGTVERYLEETPYVRIR